MQLTNHTPFHAQDFVGIDQYGQEFYVIALRQTLEWNDAAGLTYAADQQPLCESDVYWGDPHLTSIRQESDFCHFKPKCDVIVNATAYAPGGVPAPAFPVRLQVRLPDIAGDAESPQHGDLLVNKELRVVGTRQFEKKTAAGQMMSQLLRATTLGAMKHSAWVLSPPTPVMSVPLRAEYGFGGECRVVADTEAAKRLPSSQLLNDVQRAAHSLFDAQANRSTIAYSSFPLNPLGRGFVEKWFVEATHSAMVPAPQIEAVDSPLSEQDFDACLHGHVDDRLAGTVRTGYGVRPKSHPDRKRLAGTVGDEFATSGQWLPADFDFAVWNAADPDQQTQFLHGGEVIELINMCPAGAGGAQQDSLGNTVLTLKLPENECYVLLRLDSGEMFTHPMAIDTVIVEPDERSVSLVWRTVIAKLSDVPLRAAEAMMRTHAERDLDRQEVEAYKSLMTKGDSDREEPHGD